MCLKALESKILVNYCNHSLHIQCFLGYLSLLLQDVRNSVTEVRFMDFLKANADLK
jgi:hypothetical protein